MIERARQILNAELEAIKNIPITDNIEACVKLFVNCKGKIIFTGMGKAGIVARKIAATLSSTGTPSFFIQSGEAQHGDLGVISADDIVVALSNSGKTHEVLLTLKLCKETFPCITIGITGSSKSEIAQYCDYVLEIGTVTEVCPFKLAPTSSTTSMMVLGDILAVLTMEEKGFTIEEYSKRHHGGYINLQIQDRLKK